MVRRNSADVLQSSLRLTSVGVGTVPVWHAAVLTHPPSPPLPIKKNALRDIKYRQDAIRERFFQDFPFEAFRAKTMTERATVGDSSEVRGKGWWALEQRGRNPGSEDCIAFTLNLANAHKLDISKAYAIATAQFSHLRAIQEIAVRAANREAEAYGGTFAGGELARSLKKTENALRTWTPPSARSRPRPSDVWLADPKPSFYALEGTFSGGEKYVEGWKHWNEVTSQRRKHGEDEEKRLGELLKKKKKGKGQ